MTIERAKEAAGRKAATLIEPGMTVGLGTGSTVYYFIQALIEKQIDIKTVASSIASTDLAKQGGLNVLDINDVSMIDITVDGADEIDPQKRMIKGGGGAHTREKILASSSKEMIVIVDETKLVSKLGQHKLPVEILPYGSHWTLRKIEAIGYRGSWRQAKSGALFHTDNGNLIYDLSLNKLSISLEELDIALKQIPGVVETGLFLHLAGKVIIGHLDGSVTMIQSLSA